jgi:hypothetical protein
MSSGQIPLIWWRWAPPPGAGSTCLRSCDPQHQARLSKPVKLRDAKEEAKVLEVKHRDEPSMLRIRHIEPMYWTDGKFVPRL